jgi:hypothetical protein
MCPMEDILDNDFFQFEYMYGSNIVRKSEIYEYVLSMDV